MIFFIDILEEEIDLINLGGACAAPLPKKINLEDENTLADFSMIPGNQLKSNTEADKPQQQRTSVDLLSDLDLSSGSAQDKNVDLNTQFQMNSTTQPLFIQSSTPKLAYSHPSRQSGSFIFGNTGLENM